MIRKVTKRSSCRGAKETLGTEREKKMSGKRGTRGCVWV
jgi:hypothetical protein